MTEAQLFHKIVYWESVLNGPIESNSVIVKIKQLHLLEAMADLRNTINDKVALDTMVQRGVTK